MSKIILLALFVLTSCAQLMKNSEQPVEAYIDANTFKTTCSGAVEHWDSCSRKANRTCPNGYKIVEKGQDGNGTIRSMIFSCKQ